MDISKDIRYFIQDSILIIILFLSVLIFANHSSGSSPSPYKHGVSVEYTADQNSAVINSDEASIFTRTTPAREIKFPEYKNEVVRILKENRQTNNIISYQFIKFKESVCKTDLIHYNQIFSSGRDDDPPLI